MNLAYLGEQIDIHGGGNDLIFPHHENEIAQTESYTGKPFARYWMHNGMLQLKGEKMSKSLGNLVTIDEFLAEHDADVLRLVIAGSGYRKPLVFNDEVVADAERGLERLRTALRPSSGQATEGAAVSARWPRGDGWRADGLRSGHGRRLQHRRRAWPRSSIWCGRSTPRATPAWAVSRSPRPRQPSGR